MAEEKIQNNIDNKEAKPKVEQKSKPVFNRSGNNGGKRPAFKKNIRSRRTKFEKPRSEFEQKIIKIRRVTRVVKGGRRFSFSVAMVIGDKKGRVGVGVGKASDTALAIGKSVSKAKKNLIKLKLTDKMSIPHDTQAKYTSSEVMLYPLKGKGLVAGSSVRTVLELAGINEVGGKILSRSKNQLNNAMAALKALSIFQ